MAFKSSKNSGVSWCCWFIAYGTPARLFNVADKDGLAPAAAPTEAPTIPLEYLFLFLCIYNNLVKEFFINKIA